MKERKFLLTSCDSKLSEQAETLGQGLTIKFGKFSLPNKAGKLLNQTARFTNLRTPLSKQVENGFEH